MHEAPGRRLRTQKSEGIVSDLFRAEIEGRLEFRIEPGPASHGLRVVWQPGHRVIVQPCLLARRVHHVGDTPNARDLSIDCIPRPLLASRIPPLLLGAFWRCCFGGFRGTSELSPGLSMVWSSIERPSASSNEVNLIWTTCNGVKSPPSIALVRSHLETG
jgi:hypothetical protein